MLIVSGVLLVLLTWLVAGAVVASLGMLAAAVTGRRSTRSDAFRGALWWGLLATAMLAYVINLTAPLHSATAAWWLVVAVALLGVPGWWLWARLRGSGPGVRPGLTAALLACALVLAVAALGPVTNYDSGLYHLQAIRYAAEFATVPGLANVFFPLGYGNAEFPLAALMGLGPWGLDGYRLLNGLIIVLALVDLVVRQRAKQRGAGFFVLLTGMTVVVITMLPLADYWVTSPSQDSAVFTVTVVATAYLADVVSVRRWVPPAGVVIALSALLVLLRPTMVVFAAGVVVVVGLVAARRRSAAAETVPLAVVGGAAVVCAAATSAARDYVLSGWLQYPLSVLSFDVPWLAPDPSDARAATLGAARDPDNLWSAAESWQWIPAWFARLPFQWETYALLLLVIASATLAVLAARRADLQGRRLALTLLPSAAAVVFWWAFTPPSFRFAWGLVFTVATVPLGWALWRLSVAQHRALPSLAISVGGVTMVAIAVLTATARVDYGLIDDEREWRVGITVPYAISPPPPGEVLVSDNEAGLEIRVPRTGEQCWLAFPTCSPQMRGTLRLIGDGIQSGYLP